jgi:hypothetical protein
MDINEELKDGSKDKLTEGKLSSRGEDVASKRKALFGGGLSPSQKKEDPAAIKRP